MGRVEVTERRGRKSTQLLDDLKKIREYWESMEEALGHLYRVTYNRRRIDTINSPDDGHMAARNMQRIEINIHEKELCVRLVIYKDCTEMHGQEHIKYYQTFCTVRCVVGTALQNKT
jgi:hypothetical protein